MEFHHQFRVYAPLADVIEFHRHAQSMAAITPPPIRVQLHSAPAVLTNGDEMDFTLWIGPLAIHWLACIEQVTPQSFVDRQVQGPFAEWSHRHTFLALDEAATAVVDDVEATLHEDWKRRLMGYGMWVGLPLLFAFRVWKTRRLLEKSSK